MACTKNTVTTGVGPQTVFVCIGTDSSNVNVTLEGQGGSVRGYARAHLEKMADNTDAWIRVTSKDAGLWTEPSKKNFSIASSHKRGTLMRVVVELYDKANYTGSFGLVSSGAFER